jgi:hypothetical protein
VQERSTALKATRCEEPWRQDPGPLQNVAKGIVFIYMPLLLLTYIMPSTPREMTTVSKMGHPIARGLPMLRVRRQNPSDGSEPPRAIRARDEATQGVASGWHIRSPIEGTQHPQSSYQSLDQKVSFMPLRVGWHRTI